MLRKQAINLGRIVKKVTQLRGGGSALPGLVVEKLYPHFLRDTLGTLPMGVIVITGTNGKTTTTKIVAQLLKDQGMRVFTNPTGSNFTRGIAASLLPHIDRSDKLNFDIAVLELDEAHAVHFIREVSPSYTLVLNVFRDQLDRFGEINHTARLIEKVVRATTKGVVLNRDDEIVRGFESVAPTKTGVRYFGVAEELRSQFPSDADLRGSSKSTPEKLPSVQPEDVLLSAYSDKSVVFSWGSSPQPRVKLKLEGSYNLQNAAAALALVRMVCDTKTDEESLFESLAKVKPAFGRGEAIEIDGEPLEIILVKNPSGFRLSLRSYSKKPAATMIAINDRYADGRDMSWLWDVDFGYFRDSGVPFVSGIRAYDMALRLQYDEVIVGRIIPDEELALEAFLSETRGPRRIFCTYTAMLAIRKVLAKRYKLESIE